MDITVNPSITYTSDGSTTVYTFPFDYLRKAYVYVQVDNEDITTFSINSDGKSITLEEAPEEGLTIRIYRNTSATRLVSWADASVLRANDMTVQQVQLLHLAEEVQWWVQNYALILDNNATGQGITIPHGKSKGFEWNDTGTAIVLVDPPTVIKAQCEALAQAAETYRDLCLSYMQTTETYKNSAIDSATLAKKWAESEDSPDGSTDSKSSKSWSELAEKWAESPESPDGSTDSKSSKSWAEVSQSNASAAANSANYCKAMAAEGAAYDSTHTYEPGDACMTSEGNLWRCIAESTGENPSTSTKWVQVSIVETNTFEPDENGDLMPLVYPKNSSQFEVDENGDIEPAL